MNLTKLFRFAGAALCIISFTLSPLTFVSVNAQSKRTDDLRKNLGGGPNVTATLADSFPDPNGDGRAAAGEEVTYTATITNNGTVDAENVVYTNTVDSISTLVPGSAQVWGDLSPYVIRCPFHNLFGSWSGGCNPRSAYSSTTSDNYVIIGGDANLLRLPSQSFDFNDAQRKLSFDARMQNRTSHELGTFDGTNPDPVGVALFIQSLAVTGGTGTVTATNTDGAGTFTAPGQAFYQYNHLDPDETVVKNLQFHVPPTVTAFTVDFMVYTRAELKIAINEVMANPGGMITDANGEWFELVNFGQFPVHLQGFKIGDSAAAGDRPLHTIASPLVFQPHSYLVFGNTTFTTNGGVPVDYAYGSALQFSNTAADAVRFVSPNDVELDRANFSNPAISMQNGISRELKDPALDNQSVDGTNWQDALVTSVYGPGGRGTPKAANTGAPPPLTARMPNNTIAPESGETISVNVGTISPGGTAVVTYRATVQDPIPVGFFALTTQGTVSGSNFDNVETDDPATANSGDRTLTPIGPLAPTAAQVDIGGRVTRADGSGIPGAIVMMTGENGSQTAVTNPFGYYNFADVTVGESYVLGVSHKRFIFDLRLVTISEGINGVNFTAIE